MSDKVPEWANDVAATIMAEMSLIGADQSHTEFVATALLSAYRRGVEDSATVAAGTSGAFDFQRALADCRDSEYGHMSARVEIAAAIRRLGEAE